MQEYDVREQAAGRPRVFKRINKGVCKGKWDKVYEEQKKWLIKPTGTNPTITKRIQKIIPIYQEANRAGEEAENKKQKTADAKVQKLVID